MAIRCVRPVSRKSQNSYSVSPYSSFSISYQRKIIEIKFERIQEFLINSEALRDKEDKERVCPYCKQRILGAFTIFLI